MTPSGIEPAAFRFVAQYLKHVVEDFVHLLYTYSRACKVGFIRCLALLYFCSAPNLLFLFVRRDYSYKDMRLRQQGRHDLWCHWLQHWRYELAGDGD